MSVPKFTYHKSTNIKFLSPLYQGFKHSTERVKPVWQQSRAERRHHRRRHAHFRKLLTLHMLLPFIHFAAWTHSNLPGKALPCKSSRTSIQITWCMYCVSIGWWLQSHSLKIQTKITKTLEIWDMPYFCVQRWHQHLMCCWPPALHHADPQLP